jgi:hypothetical protein
MDINNMPKWQKEYFATRQILKPYKMDDVDFTHIK